MKNYALKKLLLKNYYQKIYRLKLGELKLSVGLYCLLEVQNGHRQEGDLGDGGGARRPGEGLLPRPVVDQPVLGDRLALRHHLGGGDGGGGGRAASRIWIYPFLSIFFKKYSI